MEKKFTSNQDNMDSGDASRVLPIRTIESQGQPENDPCLIRIVMEQVPEEERIYADFRNENISFTTLNNREQQGHNLTRTGMEKDQNEESNFTHFRSDNVSSTTTWIQEQVAHTNTMNQTQRSVQGRRLAVGSESTSVSRFGDREESAQGSHCYDFSWTPESDEIDTTNWPWVDEGSSVTSSGNDCISGDLCSSRTSQTSSPKYCDRCRLKILQNGYSQEPIPGTSNSRDIKQKRDHKRGNKVLRKNKSSAEWPTSRAHLLHDNQINYEHRQNNTDVFSTLIINPHGKCIKLNTKKVFIMDEVPRKTLSAATSNRACWTRSSIFPYKNFIRHFKKQYPSKTALYMVKQAAKQQWRQMSQDDKKPYYMQAYRALLKNKKE